MLTLDDIRTEVLSWLDEGSATTASSSYLNVTAAIKQAHTARLTEDTWKFMLWPRNESITTVSGQQAYSLHQEFLRPFSFVNTSRHEYMVEVPTRNIEPSGIDFYQDNDTGKFTLWGRSPVKNQPSSASVITISSSSAADTAATKAITITGDTATGVTSESITPTGTTPVAGTVQFTQILSVTKGADWAGTMTMTSNSAAVTNLTLFPTEYGRSYQQMNLLYLPTAGETISYRFYRRPKELVNDTDVLDIPAPFERVVVFDTLLLMGAYDNRLDGGRSGLWRELRDNLDFQMRQAMLEGQSIGAQGRYIMERGKARSMQFPD